MLDTIFATKGAMSQAWTKQGKRLAITKCIVDQNVILGKQKILTKVSKTSTFKKEPTLILEIGYGKKKLKNTPKPLRTIIKESGFSNGFKQIKGIRVDFKDDKSEADSAFEVGQTLNPDQILAVGDIVKVQGTSKGRGFTGVMKRYGMSGGFKTHGQRDRDRAVGSIGASADWSRVFPGKRMPGHMGDETVTVANLIVAHIDPQKNEVWLSGPIPGHRNAIVKIVKTGQTEELELDRRASGLDDKTIDQAQESEKDETEKKEKEEKDEQQPMKDKEKNDGKEDSKKNDQENEDNNDKESNKKKNKKENKNKKTKNKKEK